MLTREQKIIINKYFAENMDLSDLNTLSVLASVNEVDQNQALIALTSKLYDKIVARVDDIDYASIPESQGDIDAVDNFAANVECLEIISDLLKEYNEPLDPVNIINDAIENIRSRKNEFHKGFITGTELVILLYNNIVLSIFGATSFLIASTIEFIKGPSSSDTYEIAIKKNSIGSSNKYLLYSNLSIFNNSCKKGDIDKTIDMVFKKSSSQFLGFDSLSLVGGIALITLIVNIIPILQEIVYFFYYIRQKISDYFELQAELLEMNYSRLEMNDLSNKSKSEIKMIVSKQKAIATNFKKIAAFFAVKSKSAEKLAKEDAAKKEKYKIDDITDTKLDSSSDSSGSLF